MLKTVRIAILFMLISIPCSAQWTILESGTKADLKTVFFVDEYNGWAAGNHGVIIMTTNGGSTWNLQETPIDKTIHSIQFINQNYGYATTQERELLLTKNGGANWTTFDFGENIYTYSVFFVDSLIGLAGGYDNTDRPNSKSVIFKTLDGGTSWERIYEISYANMDTPNIFNHILFDNKDNGLIVETNFNSNTSFVRNTINGGISWEATGSLWGKMFSIEKACNDTIWACGLYGISISYDNGNTWDMKSIEMWNKSIEPISGQKGWFLRYFTNENTDAIIGYTNDACETYTIILTTAGGQNLNDLASIDGKHLWAVGDSGVVMYYNNVTSIQEWSSQYPGFYVLHQNHPNPFNPETVIRFNLKDAGRVKIAVYNILGQRVRTLVNTEMNAGQHSVTWDGTNTSGIKVAGGVYIYRMETAGQVYSKKMVMLK